MKVISGEKVTAKKKNISTKGNKIEFDKSIDTKEFKAMASHGSHRSHSSG